MTNRLFPVEERDSHIVLIPSLFEVWMNLETTSECELIWKTREDSAKTTQA